ncbi:MAG TPA: glycine--tRNA ligase [Chloroflexota bacterium]|nr:glycine--tRNA ligase [Chloroflexota bacterium]
MAADFDKITSLAKRRGFVFQSSEIYGGLNSTWDFGPLGVELKNNIKRAWWRSMVQLRDDIVGLDAAILMAPQVWRASGHLETFTDPLVDCKACKMRFRADQLVAERCPNCGGELTEPRPFNLMFKTFMGPVEDDAAVVYLRPETAQGIFVNFQNVRTVTRKRLPFGIAQIGKSFRNEISPGNFFYRSREFEQMECEYFVPPAQASDAYRAWINERYTWYLDLGIKPQSLRRREHEPSELSHYSAGTTDVEFLFPWGWGELEGIANRTDFDLRRHGEFSGKDLAYVDDVTGERYVPYVVEPAGGVDRAALAFLCDAYDEAEVKGEQRTFLRLDKRLAPYKVAVLPLSKRESLTGVAREIERMLRPHWMIIYDETQSIGRRYARQDEIGTPFCVTVDFDTLEDRAVTIRERDSMLQDRVPIAELVPALREKLEIQ